MLIRNKKAQSIIEYVTLVVIVIGAFVAMSFYIKRGIQGKWKETIDNLGDQYDPTYMSTRINYTLYGNSTTLIRTEQDYATGGFWTNRTDESFTQEKKEGQSTVSSY